MTKKKLHNVLVIGDTHYPFAIDGHLKFLEKVYKKYKCDTVVHVGDIIDQHAISFHEREPDSLGFETERSRAKKDIVKLAKLFPKMKLCLGNHDLRLYRVAAKKAGIPVSCMKPIEELYDLPKGWDVAEEFYIDDVKYFHGEGYSGQTGHVKAAIDARQSIVMGHLHAFAGINYIANTNELIFAMNSSCLIDAKKYAMRYGKSFRHKPTVVCSVVINGTPHLEYMDLGKKVKRTI